MDFSSIRANLAPSSGQPVEPEESSKVKPSSSGAAITPSLPLAALGALPAPPRAGTHPSLAPRGVVPHLPEPRASDDSDSEDEDLGLNLGQSRLLAQEWRLTALKAAVERGRTRQDLDDMIGLAEQARTQAQQAHPVTARREFAMELVTPGPFNNYKVLQQTLADLDRAAGAWESVFDHHEAATKLAMRLPEVDLATMEALTQASSHARTMTSIQDVKFHALDGWCFLMSALASSKSLAAGHKWVPSWNDLGKPVLYRAVSLRLQEALNLYCNGLAHGPIEGLDIALLDVQRTIEGLRRSARAEVPGDAPTARQVQALEAARDELLGVAQCLRQGMKGEGVSPDAAHLIEGVHRMSIADAEPEISEADALPLMLAQQGQPSHPAWRALHLGLAEPFQALYGQADRADELARQSPDAASVSARLQHRTSVFKAFEEAVLSGDAALDKLQTMMAQPALASISGQALQALEAKIRQDASRCLGHLVHTFAHGTKALLEAAYQEGEAARLAQDRRSGMALRDQLGEWLKLPMASPLLARMRAQGDYLDQCMESCTLRVLWIRGTHADRYEEALGTVRQLQDQAATSCLGRKGVSKYKQLRRDALLTAAKLAYDEFEALHKDVLEQVDDALREARALVQSLHAADMVDALPNIVPTAALPVRPVAPPELSRARVCIEQMDAVAVRARDLHTAWHSPPEDAPSVLHNVYRLSTLALRNIEVAARARKEVLKCGGAVRRAIASQDEQRRSPPLVRVLDHLAQFKGVLAEAMAFQIASSRSGELSELERHFEVSVEAIGWELRSTERLMEGLIASISALLNLHLAQEEGTRLVNVMERRPMFFEQMFEKIDDHRLEAEAGLRDPFKRLIDTAKRESACESFPAARRQEPQVLEQILCDMTHRVRLEFNLLAIKLTAACMRQHIRHGSAASLKVRNEFRLMSARMRANLTELNKLVSKDDPAFARDVVARHANAARLLNDVTAELDAHLASAQGQAASTSTGAARPRARRSGR